MTDDYEYFEKEGAYFRREKGRKVRAVQHVLNRRTGAWENYTGDKLAPVVFGDQVTEREVQRAILGLDLIAGAE